ncbi:glycosyltransferase [Raoultella terrigena]|uniref:glycosyltransferase n=1 Tax=Raoultella terrigena TaxID=577 RepID=UPI000F4CB55F|nr:glycosyltransferase [Raoultella terrigena]ROR98353.1 glycosyltransferase involved in cell wall biosynthesis [Raoultella terrigena]
MIFYCETRMFSGQERMFLTGACEASKKEQCTLLINKNNKEGIVFAKTEGCFHEIKLLNDFNETFSSLVVWLRWGKIYFLYKFLLGKQGVFCASQGRIESGNIGIIAAKLARLKVISYIPMVHSHKEMGTVGIVGAIKDLLCKPLYYLPDAYITISDAVKQELAKKCSAKIYIVENFVQQKKMIVMTEKPPYFFDRDYYKIVIPGRLQNKQKGQLDFLEAFKKIKDNVDKSVVCYIVGDGPDFELISKEIINAKLSDNVFLLGNRNDLLNIMEGSNLVVLPSRFEGVPLVLLEAASLNVQILTSDIIGFNNYLSSEHLFEAGNVDSISSKIIKEINQGTIGITYSTKLIELTKRDKKSFTADFYNALNSCNDR